MSPHPLKNRAFLPFLLGIILIYIYITTMAPGLSWANGGTDSGDLISATAVGGVAHPTGYPTYLLLARLFQLIPLGSLAYRTNLMSAFFMVVASLFLYAIILQYHSAQNKLLSQFSAVVAALMFGLSPLVWSQAIITEVYALHACLMSIFLYLSLVPNYKVDAILHLRGLCLGIALGNHVTSLLLLPIIIVDVLIQKNASWRGRLSSLFQLLCWITIGLTVYLILPLRAASYPPVNWGNPQTWDGFIWLVTGQLYQRQLFLPFILRIPALASLLLVNFHLAGIYLSLLGVVYFFQPSRFYGYTLMVALIFSLFALQYRTVDSDVYLIPVFISIAAWIGIGINGVLDPFEHFTAVKVLIGVILVIYLMIEMWDTLPKVDASKDTRADQFAEVVFSKAPEDALVFAKGDKAVFTLWYYHYTLHQRPDLSVIASDLLHYPWYLDTLRNTYPSLDLSEPFPWEETIIVMNPERPVCNVLFTDIPQVECSSP